MALKYFCDGCGLEVAAEQAQKTWALAEHVKLQPQTSQVFCEDCFAGVPEYWSGPYTELMKELASLTESRLKNTAREFFRKSKLREVKTANS